MEVSVYKLDVKSAFLNDEILKEVYVEQPKKFKVKRQEDTIYHLKKALYGLKQAHLAWNTKINSYLIENGFKQCKRESSLYVKTSRGEFLVVCLYVDDLIYYCTNASTLVW